MRASCGVFNVPLSVLNTTEHTAHLNTLQLTERVCLCPCPFSRLKKKPKTKKKNKGMGVKRVCDECRGTGERERGRELDRFAVVIMNE